MPPMERQWLDLDTTYLDPVVDLDSAGRAARERLWALKKSGKVREEAHRILAVHVAPAGAVSNDKSDE